MNTNEIRNSFLNYFTTKEHSIVRSSSLVPMGDPTLLFSNAGMVQFKDLFLATEKRSYTRATSSQKCLRISGKHNDLENVGRTARHHTFFEMLGNFSFGDYFKEDAIKFAWEFLTEELQLSKDRLWVSIFKDDDEAGEIWRKATDVLEGRILRFGEEENFWAMGDTGPCGPCTEIHYYLGDDVNDQSEEEMRKGDGTYLEIWNLVFMQFNRDPGGKLTLLPKPSVDTGMGLERIAVVKQGVSANYDTDLLRRIIAFTEDLCQKTYIGTDYTGPEEGKQDPSYDIDVAMRVITDHSRACSFLIADGINPGSDGRGYVLRRLIRRACRHGRVLGFKEAFLYKVAGEVVAAYGDAYPELSKKATLISKTIKAEEEKFIETLDTGLSILTKEVQKVKSKASNVLSGKVAFTLHDTYGFPLDMTEDIVRTHGLSVDVQEFSEEMELQRRRSRTARASEAALVLQRAVRPVATSFVGYEHSDYESEVVGVFDSTGEISVAKAGQEIALVAKESPFYAESGGQLGDTGGISSNNCSIDVVDTQKVGGDTIVHICKVVEGEISTGVPVRLSIDDKRRKLIRANHSCTHLLHLALREVLGEHVKQAGSRVSESTLRFDFSHPEPIKPDALVRIEEVVCELIRDNDEVITEVLPIDEAKRSGAVALFGEKYGEHVRVVQIGPRSREFCGGTHVRRSGDIGFMTMLSEGGVAAGVRRVEAYAGFGAFKQVSSQKQIVKGISALLKTGVNDLYPRVEKLMHSNRELEQKIEHYNSMLANTQSHDLAASAVTLSDGSKMVYKRVDNVSPKQLRELADDLRERLGQGCIALASVNDGKVVLLTAVTDNLTNRFHAGKLIEEVSKVLGGSGGGRAELAQAGGGDPGKIELALERFKECVS